MPDDIDSRPRFSGETKVLVDALAPAVQDIGRSWIKYDDNPLANKAKLDTNQIKASHGVLAALRSVQHNLSFKKTQMQDVVRGLLTRFADKPEWQLKAETKHPQTAWVRELPWHLQVEDKTASSKPNASVTWLYYWAPSMRKAHRYPDKKNGEKKKEICSIVRVPERCGVLPTDSVIAEWPDGSTWEVADCTIEQFIGTTRPRTGGPSSSGGDEYWEGEHAITHNKLVCKFRADRSPLFSLYEQQAQILQDAWNIIHSIAIDYSKDSIKKENLKQIRNDRSQGGISPDGVSGTAGDGGGGRRGAAAKRPAACQAN
ncbi:unnamed protein product [Prorocentrum cordatum]|uniref:Uncharacterized protein n=1 Tax=Prorocentrum cordatum TaxID=2364126 RepID=A0ABN9T248_9DINO|nr:unnamed protein product [Polarella glacialis]